MSCNFCKEEKNLVLSSIYIGAVCIDCYKLANNIHNLSRSIFKIYEPYETESGKAEIRQINAFNEVVRVWQYKNRGYMFRELKRKVDKLLIVRDCEGRVQ